jgi:hypothetical protein
MTVSKRYLTILTNSAFVLLSGTLAYLTDWFFIVPLLFGLGIPLVNAQGTLTQKGGKTFVIEVVSIALFLASLMSPLGAFFNIYVYMGLVAGVSGIVFLGIHALLIDTVNFNVKSVLTTTILTATSFLAWVYILDSLNLGQQPHEKFIRTFGPMTFWMVAVTIGIATGIEKEKN